MSEFRFLIGIDLGNTSHAVCILDDGGKKIRTVTANTDHSLLQALSGLGVAADCIAVAVEDRNNVVVDALLSLGFCVFSINPKQMDRFRERRSVAGAKDDRRDAWTLARALHTDFDAFRALKPIDDDVIRIAALQAERDALDDEHRRLSNQLRASLLRHFPLLLNLCSGADEPWFWAIVELLRTAANAKSVRPSRISEVLKKHRKRAVTVVDVCAVIDLPHLLPSSCTASAAEGREQRLIEQLLLIEKHRLLVKKELDARLDALKSDDGARPSDVDLLRSMPGVGPTTTATLLTYALPALRSHDLASLRAQAGVAPVTRRSGKLIVVGMRYACNQRLREALFHAAHSAARHDDRFRARYAELAARGHSRPRILRALGDKMLHVLVAMFSSRSLYTPAAESA